MRLSERKMCEGCGLKHPNYGLSRRFFGALACITSREPCFNPCFNNLQHTQHEIWVVVTPSRTPNLRQMTSRLTTHSGTTRRG